MRLPTVSQLTLLLISAPIAALAASGTVMRTIHSQPSCVIATKQVEVAITRRGGHMAPVTFFRDSDHPVQPYHITPWQDEKPSAMTQLG